MSETSMESVKKITEKSEKARREFFKKVEKLMQKTGHSEKFQQDCADKAAQEYSKLFGRLGVHPLLHLKGGKKLPRYVLDRDEVWVVYKPPLWQMGGSEKAWKESTNKLVAQSASMSSALDLCMDNGGKAASMYEFHGLSQGTMWMDEDQKVTSWGFIQRLDLETDGPIIVAKTWRCQRFLQVQMREHVFSKAYLCLVHGRVDNKIQVIKAKFAELGSEASTQVMLKNDKENDPFYEEGDSGRWTNRAVRWAETFFKPIAYYTRKEDNTEYSLVYVNILTGITHQIRITMQSVGHPLVSDDRYLPKEQAMADLKWCPRNFLTEVRSDWWDACGPYKDEKRRRFTRVSLENPLPKLFQGILDNKLTLVEKLDVSADLTIGCQYWALGDEQLMNAYPKDNEYRRKVTRWCQRKGIHLDAIDRLMLLPQEEIEEVLNSYYPPGHKNDPCWVCPCCMGFNQPDKRTGAVNSISCTGGLGKGCEGSSIVDEENYTPVKGWLDYAKDPTIHLLMQVNPRWLDARRKILKFPRPSWEKPPPEPEGSPITPDVLQSMESALVLNAKAGGFGLVEEELKTVPGLEDLKYPLQQPPEDCKITRCRRPGCGTMSQWTYSLRGAERVNVADQYAQKTKKLDAPVRVKADPLPEKMLFTKEDKQKKRKAQENEEKRAAKDEAIRRHEDEERKQEKEEKGERAHKSLLELDEDVPDSAPPAKKQNIKKKWKKVESSSNPGNFYYFDSETGDTRTDRPLDFQEESKIAWKRVESKSNPGSFFFHNSETGESRIERPSGVEVSDDIKGKSQGANRPEEPRRKSEETETKAMTWERRESQSVPGQYYYFCIQTGANEARPPKVEPPWKLLESKSKKGQFYYYHDITGETRVDPPPCAMALEPKKPPATNAERLPPSWTKRESSQYKGKHYYVNDKTGEVSWSKPPDSEWDREESKSNPGVYYYVNRKTGETSWDKAVMNGK